MNYVYFEIISHEIEYLNELTMSFVDLVLLWSLCQFQGTSVVMAGIASAVALIQLAVYNGMGRTDDGDMVGEVAAHYLEFTFGIISSLIAFWFCMDNKVRLQGFASSTSNFYPKTYELIFALHTIQIVCGKEIGEILYGTHEYCNICDASSKEFWHINKPNSVRYGSV